MQDCRGGTPAEGSLPGAWAAGDVGTSGTPEQGLLPKIHKAVAISGSTGGPWPAFPLLPRPPGAMQLDSGLPVLKSELLNPSLRNEELRSCRSCTAWAQLAQSAPHTPPLAGRFRAFLQGHTQELPSAETLSPNYWEALAKLPAPPMSGSTSPLPRPPHMSIMSILGCH